VCDEFQNSEGLRRSLVVRHPQLTEVVFDLFGEIHEKFVLQQAGLETLDERVRYVLELVADYFIANPEAKRIAIHSCLTARYTGSDP